MNLTAPSGNCRPGTYAFKYIRSMHSTSRVTWPASTSATLRGSVTAGSGRHRPPTAINRFGRFKTRPSPVSHLGSNGAHDQTQGSGPAHPGRPSTGSRQPRLVGLGRSPVRWLVSFVGGEC